MSAQPIADRLLAWAADEGIATPSYLLCPASVRWAVGHLREELGARISYATKANAHPAVVGQLVDLVDEFNVTNLAHLDQLLGLGVEPSRIAWVHPAAPAATFAAAAERGVTRFVVDDRRGLGILRSIGTGLRLTFRLLPPDIGESTHSVVRFGTTGDAVRELVGEALGAGMELEALSFFVGTSGGGMGEALPFRRGIESVAAVRETLAADGVVVPVVNIGGGFPGARRRFHAEHPDFFARIRKALSEEIGEGVGVLCEPGRYLSEPSMAMLARVVADRSVGGRRLVHIDASAYGGLFETSFIDRGGDGLEIWTTGHGEPPAPAEVLGPIMDSFDVVKRGASLPPVQDGELVVLPNIGGYSWTYFTSCEGLEAPDVIELPASIDDDLLDIWYD